MRHRPVVFKGLEGRRMIYFDHGRWHTVSMYHWWNVRHLFYDLVDWWRVRRHF